jgi:hypothetical protein
VAECGAVVVILEAIGHVEKTDLLIVLRLAELVLSSRKRKIAFLKY